MIVLMDSVWCVESPMATVPAKYTSTSRALQSGFASSNPEMSSGRKTSAVIRLLSLNSRLNTSLATVLSFSLS